ncbi:MAG: response regulator, partial [Acidobacteriota bacterium]
LNRLKDGKFTTYTTKDGLSNDMVTSLYQDREGSLWVGTAIGLNRFKDGKFTTYTTKDGLSNDYIRALYQDREGGLWIGTFVGLNRFKDGKFTTYTIKDGIPNDDVMILYEDKEGGLWVGTNGGLCRIKEGKFSVYTVKEGLSNGIVSAIYEDNERNLWIGTQGDGLNRLKDGKFTKFTMKEGLFDDAIHVILEDDRENLWMSTNRGVFQVSKQQLNSFADGKIKSINCIAYNVDDGMKSAECNGGLQPSGWKTKDNRLWFPTIKGVIVVDPNNINTNSLIPPIHIEEILIDKKRIDFTKTAEVKPGSKEIEFHYTALSLLIPGRVKFKYKLEGFDKEWVEAGTRRTAYYTNLPPGKYRFVVTACNSDGIWNETSSAFDFYLQPYFYQTKLFYVLCILSIILVITSIFHLRVRYLKNRHKELSLLVEAAQAATRAKSLFLATMSHEIRTPMNAVVGMTGLLLDTHLTAEQQEYVETIKIGSESLLTIINDILDFSKIECDKIDIEQRAFILRDCVEGALDLVSAGAYEKGLDLAYLLEPKAPQVILGDITRLRQILVNLLNNAIKFTQQGEVLASVSYRSIDEKRHEFEFSIKDTGIGIPKNRMDRLFQSFSQVDASTSRHFGGTGLGLAISKKLAEMMGGRIWVESQEEVGSTFYFTIVAESVSEQPPLDEATEVSLKDKRVLVVDDNTASRMVLIKQTEFWGMIVETANSGVEAINLLQDSQKEKQFDLVILDHDMTQMDGLTLATEIKKLELGKRLPIVLLASGATSKCELMERDHGTSCAAYLAKPIRVSQLFQVLSRLLKKAPVEIKPQAPAQLFDKRIGEQRPLKILLAEDNLVNQKVALRILEKIGYKADIATNGIEVLAALERQTYDVIFMDVQMPEMDGLEATRLINERWQKEKRPRIIALTANAIQGDREECLAAGMDDYVSKPVKGETLRAALDRCNNHYENCA